MPAVVIVSVAATTIAGFAPVRVIVTVAIAVPSLSLRYRSRDNQCGCEQHRFAHRDLLQAPRSGAARVNPDFARIVPGGLPRSKLASIPQLARSH
jgi:hypothetical protein